MTQGEQGWGCLGRHDPGHFRHGQRIALGQRPALDQGKRFVPDANSAGRQCPATGDRLGGNVRHAEIAPARVAPAH